MSPAPGGLATLATVRQFLTDLVPEVSGERAGEVRAAVKLLETAEIELNVRHNSLTTETDDLIGYCREIGPLVGRRETAATCEQLAQRLRAGATSMTALDELWRDTRSLTTSLLTALQRIESDPATSQAEQRAAADLLERVYGCLGAHARSRLSWQSVFPVYAPAGVDSHAVNDHRKDLR
ncbi:MAG: hypothetical protein IVW52_09230 [Acidimicrobiales bacterium]|nr:hypothetical protein [Acidimicrobiales bacterium]